MSSRIVEEFEAHGLRCVVATGGPQLRNFNGYVEAPEGVSSLEQGEIDVHGGVTWLDWNLPWEIEIGDRLWVGFDTAHAGDFVPAMPILGGVFRDAEYVKSQCVLLASQLAERGKNQ